MKESGRYEVVDSAPIAKDIEDKSPMYKCNGCEDDLAKKVGADIAFIGTVRKASDVLFTVSIYVRDVKNQKVDPPGFERDLRQYRQDVAARCELHRRPPLVRRQGRREMIDRRRVLLAGGVAALASFGLPLRRRCCRRHSCASPR